MYAIGTLRTSDQDACRNADPAEFEGSWKIRKA